MACNTNHPSDSVKTCPNGFARALARPPKSESYINRDTVARSYEAKKWQELLDDAKQRKICLGCDICSPRDDESQCFMHMADDLHLLLGDTLIVREVTVLSTGSLMCWRVTANLADQFWLSETNEEHVLNALFAFATARIHNLATMKNFVREADVFGNSRYYRGHT